MVAYGRRDGGFWDYIKDAILWLLVFYWAYYYFGWKGPAVLGGLFAVLIIIAIIAEIISKIKKQNEDKRFMKLPCKHGAVGALYDYKLCLTCQQEKEAAIEKEEKRRAEEKATKKAEKDKRHKEWIAKIRLPEYLREMDWRQFELLICDLFRRIGYEVESTPPTADGGIDGYLRKDGELAILQCKRFKGGVGEPVLRNLLGTMTANKAKRGFIVTTGKVSQQAKLWVANQPIKIIELDELVDFIRNYFPENEVIPDEYDLNPEEYQACPRCGKPLKIVSWKGTQFWGCSGYPSCRYTRSIWRNYKK
jgi:ssDNA-binding Zn-finger/Zn-ribbon topoisomerase 1